MTPCTCIDIHKYELAFSRDGAEGYVALFVLFFFIKIIRNRKDEHVQYVYNIRIQYRIQLIQRNSIFVKISYNGFH